MLDVANFPLLIAKFCGIPSNSVGFCSGTQLIYLELVGNFIDILLNLVRTIPDWPLVEVKEYGRILLCLVDY